MKDEIVEQVVHKFHMRSDVCIRKYGTTLEGNNTDNFLEHALEEAMDFTLYIMKIKSILKAKGYSRLEDIPDLK